MRKYGLPHSGQRLSNIADAGLPNTHATSVSQTNWGWFDWILDIISVRVATIEGTWGFTGEGGPSAGAKPGSS